MTLLTAHPFFLTKIAPAFNHPTLKRRSRCFPFTPHSDQKIPTIEKAQGAWISEDLVRKANNFGKGHCDGGEPGRPGPYKKLGCEIGVLNIGETANNLKLSFDEWDYNATKPQSSA